MLLVAPNNHPITSQTTISTKIRLCWSFSNDSARTNIDFCRTKWDYLLENMCESCMKWNGKQIPEMVKFIFETIWPTALWTTNKSNPERKWMVGRGRGRVGRRSEPHEIYERNQTLMDNLFTTKAFNFLWMPLWMAVILAAQIRSKVIKIWKRNWPLRWKKIQGWEMVTCRS